MFVYKIINSVNDKIYIGQTTRTIDVRWKEHVWSSHKISVSHLHNAIKKYGKDNFKITTICKCDDIEQLNYREEYYIKLFKTLTPNGYNIQYGGGNYSMNTESRIRHALSHGGKPFLVRNLETDEITKFQNQTICSEKLSMDRKSVGACLSGKYFCSNGFSFSYLDDVNLPPTKQEIKSNKRLKLSRVKGGRVILARNLDTNEIIEFKTTKDAQDVLEIGNGIISMCIKNPQRTAKNHTFSLKSENKSPLTKKEVVYQQKIINSRVNGGKPILARNLDTNEIIEFQVQSDCNKILKISNGRIKSCIDGDRYQTKGYSFSYRDNGLPPTKQEIKELKWVNRKNNVKS